MATEHTLWGAVLAAPVSGSRAPGTRVNLHSFSSSVLGARTMRPRRPASFVVAATRVRTNGNPPTNINPRSPTRDEGSDDELDNMGDWDESTETFVTRTTRFTPAPPAATDQAEDDVLEFEAEDGFADRELYFNPCKVCGEPCLFFQGYSY